MKIVFRLNYHTEPGQSLWLKLATLADEGRVRIDHVPPLRWSPTPLQRQKDYFHAP